MDKNGILRCGEVQILSIKDPYIRPVKIKINIKEIAT